MATLDALIVHDRPTSDSRVTWTVVNGPGDVDVVDPSAPSVTVRFPETGRYVLRVAAEAGGAMTSDEIVCVVNTTPTVGIVAESTVQLPASLGLRGVVIADGSGDPSMTTTASWAMVAGPGRVTFDDPDALATTASFSAHGRYDLRLEIDNGAFIGSADIVVAVFAAPLLTVEPIPVVTAGDDGTADIPLTATIVDPGLGDPAAPVSAEWSLVSGPADVDIEQLPDANATASVTRNGDYVFRLRVDNGQLSTAATSTVTVNQRPTVDAGIARTVELPARVHLDATVGDDGLPHDPGRVSLLWEQTDGPGGVVFSHATADRTAAAFPRPGTYVLAITADDGAARTTDTVVVEVTAPPRVVDGLAAHYLFAGGSGASVPDIAGVEPALDLAIEPTSAVAWSEPGLGSNGAAKIDSTDAQRMVDAMLGAGGGTLEAVVTVAGAPNDTTRASHIIAVYEDRRLHLALAHDGDGFLALARRGSNRYVTVRDVGGERSADRVHVALVFDVARGVMTLLLDGVEVAAQESTGSVLESDGGTFRVSLLDDRSESAFIGTVHEAAIYGRPISAAEVNANHLATLAGHPTGT